jgi:heme-degrading monooxygenase HmoA
MFARVSTLSGDPQNVAQVESQVRDKVLPAAQQIPGFNGLLAMVDRSSGKALAVTFWESEQAMKDSEEAADRIREEVASGMGEQILGVERFEVVLDER